MTGISITTIIYISLLLFTVVIAVVCYALGRHSSYKQLYKHFDHEIEMRIRLHATNCPMSCAQQPLQDVSTLSDKRQMGELLKAYMEQYYPEFMFQLREHTNYNLTPTEELICIFSKFAMRNKEVANILKISLSSVTKTRYRVKNKMDISPDEDLDKWLRNCGEHINSLPPRRFFYPPESEEGA